MIIDIGFFLNSYLLYIVGGVVLLYIGYRLLCYNTKFVKFIDKFVFVIPIKKDIEKNYIAVNFTRNLAMLLKSGFSISVAISNCVPLIENLYIREKINTAANRLKNGESFSDVFQDLDLFKKVYIRLFNIAYKTGKLDEVLSESSVKLEEELDSNLSKFISFIEPAMIIFISIIIGVILISLIFPVIDIMNAIG